MRGELRLDLGQGLRHRRDGKVVVEFRLTAIGQLLQREDLLGIGYLGVLNGDTHNRHIDRTAKSNETRVTTTTRNGNINRRRRKRPRSNSGNNARWAT